MNALVRKEFRLILPAWSVALVALIAARVNFAFFPDPSEWIILSFCVGMLGLGLTPFGREFSSGSFAALLAQPFPRGGLWRAKMRHLGSAALTLFCVFLFLWARLVDTRNVDSGWDAFFLVTAAGLAMLTGGLWTTLVFRQITAAFWITLLVPAALAISISLLVVWLRPVVPESFDSIVLFAVLVFYSIASYRWARGRFLGGQDVSWRPVEIMLPGFAGWFNAGTRPAGEPRRRPLRALAAKELQLHSLSLFFAAGVLVLHLAAIGARKYASEWSAWRGPATIAFVFWFILPLIAGAEAVASERQLGTMEGQLCLPARRRTQFVLKLFFVLAAGLILGGVMPWLLEHAARAAGIASELETNLEGLFWFSAFAASVALISFYASSLTRSALQALGGALVALITVWMLALWGRPDPGPNQLWHWGLAHLIGGPSLAVILLGLSYWNFKRLHQAEQLWRRNLAVLGVWLAFTVVATPLVYHRAWELVLPLEPRHGPARIHPTGPVGLSSALRGSPLLVRVLLPDGRIWAGTEGDIVASGEIRLTAGDFVAGTNWTALAATCFQTAAIRGDGSLWDVCHFSPSAMRGERHLVAALKPPQRIGTDSDWKSVTAGGSHFLALKQDGSMWGWGDNSYNQLGEGTKQFTNGPVRVGIESEWTAVFASGLRSAAVKLDGSVWMWGGLYHLPDGARLKQMLRQSTPMRWNLSGTNLVSFHWIWQGELALYGDGSAWTIGHIPPGLLKGQAPSAGDDDADWLAAAPAVVTPVCVNQGENWRVVALGQSLTMLHGDGSLWESTDWWSPAKPHLPRKVSKYSDWMAVAAEDWLTYALAADGTLCCWAAPRFTADPRALLGPTRRPLWSLNILDAAK